MNNCKVIIASKAGFCMGVKNAFNKAIEIGTNHKNTVLLGDIVHNSFAINLITKSGLTVNENINEIISDTKIENIIIRAHGISPDIENILNDSNKNIFDLTCPIVKKVQLLTKELSSKNHDIIIFGKKNHPEVIGIQGYCSTNFKIISNIDEANNISNNLLNPVLISQTTMNSDLFDKIADVLKIKFNDLIIHNTLCNNTIMTQKYALKLSEISDLMIVIGDKKSSNTISLFEKISQYKKTLFVENTKDIDIKLLKNKKIIGLTGGSSTPDHQIQLIKQFIEETLKT